jgi:serine/threonine protein kinase
VDGLANFYSEGKAPDDEEIRNTFQQLSRGKEASGPVRVEDDEVSRFLKRNCSETISVKRAQELASIASKMGLTSLAEFAKYIETDRPKNQDRLSLTGYEYLSLAKVLSAKELFSTLGKTFQINGSDVFDTQPMRVAPDRTSAVVPGMFSGFILQETSAGDIIRRKVCIKTEVPQQQPPLSSSTAATSRRHRDMVMEVKMFEECSHSLVAGIVEYLGSGMASPAGPYLITEHFGMNLTQFLSLRIPPLMERIRLFTEICVTVCSLHASGLMHGAITPEHILITLSSDSSDSELASFHQVKLCNLTSCRRIGDAFPVNSTSDGLQMHSGYIAPEVFFGRVGLCRATTKIDAFTLSLVGYTLLCRKPSVLKHLFPVPARLENPAGGEEKKGEEEEELKSTLRDQERINELIYTNLDSPLSDIILSVCQLNPGERCDIETVVNMLQIRNSDIQGDLSSLMSLGDMYDELFTKLLLNLMAIKQFLVFESGGHQLFLTLLQALHSLTTTTRHGTTLTHSSSSQGEDGTAPPSPKSPPPPPMQLSEFHRALAHFFAYLRRRGYTDDPLSPRLSLVEPEEFPEEVLLNRIIDLVNENQLTMATSLIREKMTALASQLTPIETHLTSQRSIVCLFGDAIGRSLTHPSHLKYSKLLESRELWMDGVTREQVEDMRNNILKMNASLHAVKNINRGLVQFMSNELSNLQKTFLDLVKRNYPVPTYCVLLPCLSASSFQSHSLRIKKNIFRLQFLCSHTHQLLPHHLLDEGRGGEIILSLNQLARECVSPVVLTSLSVLRHALMSNPKLQESLIPGLLPPEITDPSCQLQFLTCAYHLLRTDSIYAPRLADDPPGPTTEDEAERVVDLGPLDNVPSVESVAAVGYGTVILTPDIAKFSYQKLASLIKEQNPAVDLTSGTMGLRLVTSENKKFGWILDSDDIETRYGVRS